MAALRRDQLRAGRDDGHARPAEHGNIGPANGGKQSGLAGREQRPSAQYQLALGHVSAGEAQIDAGGHRVKHLQAFSVNTRVLDHQHGIGAARQHPTRGNGTGRARLDNQARDGSRGNLFTAQSQASRRFLGCSIGVGGAERITVHVGPVERRNGFRGPGLGRKHATRRVPEAQVLRPQRLDPPVDPCDHLINRRPRGSRAGAGPGVKDCQTSIPRSWLVAAAHSDYSNGSSIDSNRTHSGNVLLDAPGTQGG